MLDDSIDELRHDGPRIRFGTSVAQPAPFAKVPKTILGLELRTIPITAAAARRPCARPSVRRRRGRRAETRRQRTYRRSARWPVRATARETAHSRRWSAQCPRDGPQERRALELEQKRLSSPLSATMAMATIDTIVALTAMTI